MSDKKIQSIEVLDENNETDKISDEGYNIETKEEIKEEIKEEKLPLIHCDGLVKIYKTKELEVMALQGLELDVNEGELMSVIGKSGSGKSTLMNIIGGLEKPSVGHIVVDGKNLSEMTEQEMVDYRKNTIGFVWQKSSRNLLNYLTSIENIEAAMCFGNKSRAQKKERANMLLEMVGLAHKKDSYPSQMSGGEQQRVAIAVALANEPKILLADEPTGAVDSKTSNMIQDLFRTLNRTLGLTIIIVTHDISLANKVDRVVMISDGKISTEKIMKEKVKQEIDNKVSLGEYHELDDDSHEEYSVMDKANRVQLSKDVLEAAGIDGNKVKVAVENGKIIISSNKTLN